MENSLIVVVMVRPESVPKHFKRKRLDWPLHVTIVPWFKVADESSFLGKLKERIASEKPFVTVVGSDTEFDTNATVSLVEDQAPFKRLHDLLLELLNDFNAEFSRDALWINQDYNPHITHHGSDRLSQGDTFEVNSIEVVRVDKNNICEVVHTFQLMSKDVR